MTKIILKYPFPYVPEGDMGVYGAARAAEEHAEKHVGKRAEGLVEALGRVFPGLCEYVERHGPHFTEELAGWAVSRMRGADGKAPAPGARHTQHRADIPERMTEGDFMYAVNMAYADFYPSTPAPWTECAEYATRLGNDPDGYEGQVFCRWLADLAATHTDVGFEKYV